MENTIFWSHYDRKLLHVTKSMEGRIEGKQYVGRRKIYWIRNLQRMVKLNSVILSSH